METTSVKIFISTKKEIDNKRGNLNYAQYLELALSGNLPVIVASGGKNG